MTCENAREQIQDRLDERLEAAQSAELDGHLSTCADCRAAEADFVALRRLLRGVPAESAPSGFADGVLARLPAGRVTQLAEQRSSPFPRWLAPFAAAAAVVIALLVLDQSGPQSDVANTRVADSAVPESTADFDGFPSADADAAADADVEFISGSRSRRSVGSRPVDTTTATTKAAAKTAGSSNDLNPPRGETREEATAPLPAADAAPGESTRRKAKERDLGGKAGAVAQAPADTADGSKDAPNRPAADPADPPSPAASAPRAPAKKPMSAAELRAGSREPARVLVLECASLEEARRLGDALATAAERPAVDKRKRDGSSTGGIFELEDGEEKATDDVASGGDGGGDGAEGGTVSGGSGVAGGATGARGARDRGDVDGAGPSTGGGGAPTANSDKNRAERAVHLQDLARELVGRFREPMPVTSLLRRSPFRTRSASDAASDAEESADETVQDDKAPAELADSLEKAVGTPTTIRVPSLDSALATFARRSRPVVVARSPDTSLSAEEAARHGDRAKREAEADADDDAVGSKDDQPEAESDDGPVSRAGKKTPPAGPSTKSPERPDASSAPRGPTKKAVGKLGPLRGVFSRIARPVTDVRHLRIVREDGSVLHVFVRAPTTPPTGGPPEPR